MLQEDQVFLSLWPLLRKCEALLTSTLTKCVTLQELSLGLPYKQLEPKAAHELLLATLVEFQVPKWERVVVLAEARKQQDYSPHLRYWLRHTRHTLFLKLSQLQQHLEVDHFQPFIDGPWQNLYRDIISLQQLYPWARSGIGISDHLENMGEEIYAIDWLGEKVLGKWGIRFIRRLEKLPFECSYFKAKDFPGSIQSLVALFYDDDSDSQTSENRKPYKQQQHIEWQQWNEVDGLSHAQIARRHKEQTGDQITASAVTKALARLRERDISQMSADF